MTTAIISYLVLSLYLTIFWILFVISIHFSPKKIELFFIPFSCVFFVEFLRNFGPLAGPWMNLSLTQSGYIRIIQLVNIETHVVSFIVILFNIMLYKYLVEKNMIFIKYFILLLCTILFFGNYQFNHQNNRLVDKSINVSIGQPVIFSDEKWNRELKQKNFQIMESLLLKSLEEKAEIIVWPEVSVPSYLATNINDRLFFQEKLMEKDSFLILGIPERKFIDGQQCRPWSYYVISANMNTFLPRAANLADELRNSEYGFTYMTQPHGLYIYIKNWR